MSGEGDAEGSGQVEVHIAVDVADVRPERLLPEDREAVADEGDVAGLDLPEALPQRPGARPRGGDLDVRQGIAEDPAPRTTRLSVRGTPARGLRRKGDPPPGLPGHAAAD